MSEGNWKELFHAACGGDLALVSYHTRQGVDLNYAHPEFLGTPLVACILAGQEAVALYLLEQGADPRLRSEFDGATPLQAARRAGLARVEQRLLAMGVQEAAPAPPPAWGLSRGLADGCCAGPAWRPRLASPACKGWRVRRRSQARKT